MPSYLHELLLLLFRNRSTAAAELLRELHVALPNYDEVLFESSDLTDVQPAEYRSDWVLFLVRASKQRLGIVVEIQLSRDDAKRYSWPAYVVNLRARHRCPVCLLVVTIEETVAAWARKSIHLGPGGALQPWVIGPSTMPAFTEMSQAESNAELAVLSAVEHVNSDDKELAVRTVLTALLTAVGIDADRSKLYFDLISMALDQKAPETRGVVMNSLGFEYQSSFARRYVAQGKAEGKLDIVIKLLVSRFGPLPEAVEARLRAATDVELDKVAERLLTAQSLGEVLR